MMPNELLDKRSVARMLIEKLFVGLKINALCRWRGKKKIMDIKMLGDGKPFDLPAIIKDPFRKDKITSIALYWYENNGKWRGYVEFKNGNTSGKQDLDYSDNLDGIVFQIKSIVESINSKP